MGVLTAEQKRQFAEEGYLLVSGLLDPEQDIQPVLDEYNGVLDGRSQRLAAARARALRYDLAIEPREPRIETRPAAARQFDRLAGVADLPQRVARAFQAELADVRQQVDLGDQRQVGGAEHHRVLGRLRGSPLARQVRQFDPA